MKLREFVAIGLIIVAVALAGVALGWWVGRAGAQRVTAVRYSTVAGMPASTPADNIRSGQRIRLYMGPAIQGEPAFTIVAGRVYRGSELTRPLLTLEGKHVYSGDGPAGPLLYRFDDNRVIEGAGDEPTRFVQRDNNIYFGSDPQAPVLFSFAGTHVYRGDPGQGRILATSNTVLSDPDLVKLVTIVLYMETLE